MPKAKAQVGQRWWVERLGWRVIVSIHHDKKQGRLYGVRDGHIPEYPLGPVSGCRDRGRFLRSRSLIRRYWRQRRRSSAKEVDTKSQVALHKLRQLVAVAKGVLCPQEER